LPCIRCCLELIARLGDGSDEGGLRGRLYRLGRRDLNGRDHQEHPSADTAHGHF
jgi:hypothetical protein